MLHKAAILRPVDYGRHLSYDNIKTSVMLSQGNRAMRRVFSHLQWLFINCVRFRTVKTAIALVYSKT